MTRNPLRFALAFVCSSITLASGLAPSANAFTSTPMSDTLAGHSNVQFARQDGAILVTWNQKSSVSQTLPEFQLAQTTGIGASPFGSYAATNAAGDVCSAGVSGSFGAYVATVATSDSQGVHVLRFPALAPFPAAGVRVSSPIAGIATVLSMRIAPLADGGCAVIWTRTSPSGTWLNRVTSTGQIAAGWRAGGIKLGSLAWRDGARVGDDRAGGVEATFFDAPSILYLTRFAANGTVVPSYPRQLSNQALASAPPPALVSWSAFFGPGGVVVGWKNHGVPFGTPSSLYASLALELTGSVNPPADLLMSNASAPIVVEDRSGGAYLVWAHSVDNGATSDLRALRVRSNGAIAPGWPDTGLVVTPPEAVLDTRVVSGDVETARHYEWNFCAADDDGGLLVAWTDLRFGANRRAVYLSHLDLNGTHPDLGPNGVRIGAEARDAVVQAVHSRGTLPEDFAYYVAWTETVPGAAPLDQLLMLTRVPAGGTEGVADATASGLSLSAPMPNPARGAFTLRCTLPRAEAARLELLDVAGRRVARRDLSGAGVHAVRLGEGAALAPGVYLARLSQGRDVRTMRVAITR